MSKHSLNSLTLVAVLAAVIFVVAFALLWLIGDYRVFASFFMAALIAFLSFIVLYLGLGTPAHSGLKPTMGHGHSTGASGAVGAGATASVSAGADQAARDQAAAEQAAARKAEEDAEAMRRAKAEAEAAEQARAEAAAKEAAEAETSRERMLKAKAEAEAAQQAREEAAAEAEAAQKAQAQAQAAADAERARAEAAAKAEADARHAEELAARKAAEEQDAARKAEEEARAAREASVAAAASAAAASPSMASGSDALGEDYDGDGVREGSDEGTRPKGLDGPRDGKADDLKQIKGVGPKLEKLCNTLGFWHFDQVAAWTADEVAWVDANLTGFKGRVSRDEWVKQAGILASGGETDFSKRVEDGDVY